MPSIKFTARGVKAIKPPTSGQVDYWDQTLTGFGLRVSAAGRKSWIVMYRHEGQKRRMTIGTYPPLELADARDMADGFLRDAGRGLDPAATKKAGRKAETFKELAAAYIERYAKKRKKSWEKDDKAITRDLNPAFGNRKANSITRQDVTRLLEKIVDRGAPIQANRTHEILRRIFNWAIKAGEAGIDTNPAAGTDKPSKENQREKVLTDDEIRAVWEAMDAQSKRMGAMFKLRLVTAQRGGEISYMRWPDIDGDWWTIPGEYSKNGRAHRVPLSALALAILEEVRPETGKQEWVFLSPSLKGPITSIWKATADIRERSAVDFRPHDLRRTASSLMTGRLGVPRFDVKKILNHVDPDVTAIYDRHSYDPEKRRALDAWGELLEKIIANDKAKGCGSNTAEGRMMGGERDGIDIAPALQNLVDEIERAGDLFDSEIDSGRVAVGVGLMAFLDFMEDSGLFTDKARRPLVRILMAMDALDRFGTVDPIIAPRKRDAGRQPHSPMELGPKGCAAAAMECFMLSGRGKHEAAGLTAHGIRQWKIAQTDRFGRRTVAKWRETISGGNRYDDIDTAIYRLALEIAEDGVDTKLFSYADMARQLLSGPSWMTKTDLRT